jgi:hypothetical protein
MTGTTFSLEVRPTIPQALSRLTDLASNLLYSWDRGIRHLFSTLDPGLWEATGHNPRLFLRRVDQDRLNQAAVDPLYLRHYVSCVSSFDTYLKHRHSTTVTENLDKDHDLVAYFCAEYGVPKVYRSTPGDWVSSPGITVKRQAILDCRLSRWVYFIVMDTSNNRSMAMADNMHSIRILILTSCQYSR